MKKSKILVRINNLEEINDYKKVGITNFLFALDSYSIGYNTFKLEELKKLNENIYLLVNRVFENKDVDSFKELKNELSFVKGIIYEDIAVYQIMKDANVDLIWNQAHFAVSTNSVNFWLNKVSSVMLSNELEKEELNRILESITKQVVVPVLGLNMAMYSRRYLLSYYNEYKNLDKIKKAILKTNNNIEFLAIENEYGTVFFYHKYFNLINEIDNINEEKILFYYIDANELTAYDVIDIISGKEISYDNRFYEKKTVYKVGDLDD